MIKLILLFIIKEVKLLSIFNPKVFKDILIIVTLQILAILFAIVVWKVVNPQTLELQRLILLSALGSPFFVFVIYDLYLIFFKKRTVFIEATTPFIAMSLEDKPARFFEAVLLAVGTIIAIILIIWASYP